MSGTTTMNVGLTALTVYTGASGAVRCVQLRSSTRHTILHGHSRGAVCPDQLAPLVIGSANSSVTVGAANAVDDTSAGGNTITSTNTTVIFAAPNDTITASAGSTTLFGGGFGRDEVHDRAALIARLRAAPVALSAPFPAPTARWSAARATPSCPSAVPTASRLPALALA